MNTLKNVLFFGLLLAVLCGVYLSLNRSPEPVLPPGLSADTRPPKIEIPGLTGPVAPISSNPDSSGPPSFPAQPPTLSTPPARADSAAPPFAPPAADPAGMTPAIASSGSFAALPPPPAAPATLAPPPATAALPAPPGSPYPPGVSDPFVAGSGSASSSAALPPPPAEHAQSTRIDGVMEQFKLEVEKNRYADALLILSQLYGSPDLPAPQARVVTSFLDQMAGKVIYSREHWLEGAYRVQASDTLEIIADRYQVPALLLARINGIRDPQNLPPGTELKVLKGPFSAQISTDRSEMTLMLAGRYAGRFNVVLSNDLSRSTNMCTVRDKRAASAAPGSGAGRQWIELSNAGGNISMQGTNDTRVAAGRDSRNTIWLSEQDMDDVFGILSTGSRVIIQR